MHIWFESNFLLLSKEVDILIIAYDKQSIFTFEQLSIKSGKWENYSKVRIILGVIVVEKWKAKRWIVDYTNTSFLISSKIWILRVLKTFIPYWKPENEKHT